MTSEVLFAALLVGAGTALVLIGLLTRARSRASDLAEILDLPYGERDVPVEAVTEGGGSELLRDTLGRATTLFDTVDSKGLLRGHLERARVPMRPGELVMLVVAGGAGAGLLVAVLTSQWLLGAAALLASPFIAKLVLARRISSRRKRLEAQLPEALSLIASSLSAGHTFLRAIQMMAEETEPPLAEELARVVTETQLGDSVVDALERMAHRTDLRDLVWVVQAIRIQQTVGGKLADLLHSLADFMRAREEIRREVNVLTAEGRFSAWVLGALPVFILLAIQVISPDYLDPMFQGWGLVVLALTAGSVLVGLSVILRMVRIEV